MKKEIKNYIIIVCLLTIIALCFDLIARMLGLNTNYDLLGFLGALIGGFITYLGVKMTLDYQRKSDNENRRLSLLPYFNYEISHDNYCGGELIKEVSTNVCETEQKVPYFHLYFNLTIKNEGIGHAILNKMDLIVKQKDNIIGKTNETMFKTSLLLKNGYYYFRFIIIIDKFPEETNLFLYPAEIELTYQDMIKNVYKQKIPFYIESYILKDGQSYYKAKLSDSEPFEYVD